MNLIDTNEVQTRTSFSRSTINRARKQEIGRSVRFDLKDIEAWVAGHQQG